MGSTIPAPITGSQIMEVRFTSDGSVLSGGFTADIACAAGGAGSWTQVFRQVRFCSISTPFLVHFWSISDRRCGE